MQNDPQNDATHSPTEAQNNAPADSSRATSSGVIVDEHGKPYPETKDAKDRRRKSEENNLADRIKSSDRWMILLTGIIAVSTIGQGVTVYFNNRSASDQIEKLIVAANRIDDAADSFSTSASHINEGIGKAVTALGQQALASRGLVTQVGKQSATAKASYEEQVRPYIGEFQVLHTKVQGANMLQAMKVQVFIRNFGQIPAYGVDLKVLYFIDSKQQSETKVPDIPPTLQPGGTFEKDALIGSDAFMPILSKQTILRIYLVWTYSWRERKERGCAAEQYKPDGDNLLRLGPICPPDNP